MPPKTAARSRKTVKPAPITAPRKKVLTGRAALDAALVTSPHNPTWNPEEAERLALFVVDMTNPTMPFRDALALMNAYKNVAGWKNMVKTAAAAHLGTASASRKARK